MSCALGYYLSSNGTCLLSFSRSSLQNIIFFWNNRALSLILIFISLYSFGYCSSCYQGYALSGDNCSISIKLIFWVAWQSPVLSAPPVLRAISSQKLRQVADPLCSKYNLTSGLCLSRTAGYIYSSVNCTYSQPSKDPNCLTYSSSCCVIWADGFLIHNFSCVSMDPKWICLDPTGSVCIKCKDKLTPLGLRYFRCFS